MKLEGKVALVTGAGSGIGRAIALLFAAEGARVAANDIDLSAAQQTVEQMGASKSRGLPVRADVSSSAEVRAMFEEIDRRLGPLDILVNNAGIAEAGPSRREEIDSKFQARLAETLMGRIQTHWESTQQLTDEEWHRMIGVHLDGTFFCTREALRRMSAARRGAIVNMSSVAALLGIEIASHYGAAKGAILSFTRSVAREVASRGIRVNAICPGWIDTPMTEMFPSMLKRTFAAQIPLMRWGTAEEVARTALFLASDDGSYFTGQALSPNGGLFPH